MAGQRLNRYRNVLGIGLILSAVWSVSAFGENRPPPPDKDPQAAPQKVHICHLKPNGSYSPRKVNDSQLPGHIGHGDCLIDDGVDCTSDTCDQFRGCVHTPNDTRCSDGLFCTTDSCDPQVGCVTVSTCPPSIDGCVHRNDSCDEDNNVCVDRPDDSLCEDGLFCTEDSCNAETGACGAIDRCPAFIDTENCLVYGRCDEANQACPADPLTPCCGDGVCDSEEDACTCSADCGPCCGDGECGAVERATCLCHEDCGLVCGDGCCNGGEDFCSCPKDCGNVAGPAPVCCGDGTCDAGEDECTCPDDCLHVAGGFPCCGNGSCDPSESSCSCPQDCDPNVAGGSECCGNGVCDFFENSCFCPADCGEHCGNGECDCDEFYDCSCPADCPASSCGNGICECGENESSCPDDCVCGDGDCEPGESPCTCSADCGPCCGDGLCENEDSCSCLQDCPPSCGNGTCECGEDNSSCSKDCFCGNGNCESDENSCSCSQDCGPCCGDGLCENEDSCSCFEDCPPPCGNGACECGEDNSSCSKDCFCGNGYCDSDENSCTCSADCGPCCGDGVCENEDSCSCLEDCPPTCGNGACECGEDNSGCSKDCYCGNGTVEPGEGCDDGNSNPGDGCDQNCQFEIPSNDDCGSALPIGDGATQFRNTGATNDGPSPCAGLGPDVWYEYTAPCNGTATFDTFGSGYDTVLAAYYGCTCGDLSSVLIVCNDDEGGTYQSSISFTIETGVCYKIQVGGYQGSQGSGVINLNEDCCGDGNLDAGEQCDDGNTDSGDGCDENCRIESPANDGCGSASPIGDGTTTFSNVAATTDGPSPCSPLGADVWYDYTAPCTGTATFDTFTSGFDTILAAYDGCNCADLSNVLACNDDTTDNVQSQISFPIAEGNCYKIQVGGFNEAQGSGVINVDEDCCGDGNCDPSEDASNCPSDCGCAVSGACGATAPSGCSCDCDCIDRGDCCSDAESACNLSTTCCLDLHDLCSSDTDCCDSNAVCDPTPSCNTAGFSTRCCLPIGTSCSQDCDCCGEGRCPSGSCCIPEGQPCTVGNFGECCSGFTCSAKEGRCVSTR